MAMNDTDMTAGTSSSMISSTDVNGTDVYGASSEKIGHIDHLMIDKQSGRVAYAVMHFGGFLGMGEEPHPVPWNSLTYDPSLGGYVTGITKEQLEGAPARDADWRDSEGYRDDVYRHYNAAPYWI